MSTLTIIQTNLHWEDKAANLQMLEEKILSIKEKIEIVVLPEMFSTGFSMQPEKLADNFKASVSSILRFNISIKRSKSKIICKNDDNFNIINNISK